MPCHAIPGPLPWNVWISAWDGRALGVDALIDVMMPKETQIAVMQIALACPAVSVGGGEHGSWVMVDR